LINFPSNAPVTYLGVVNKEGNNCFIGYGAIKGDVRVGLKDRTSSEEFKTLKMWMIPAPAQPFAVTYHRANLNSLIKNIESSKGKEILDD